MSVWNERAQAVRETVEAVRAIEAEGVTREGLAKIGETLVGLATRTELFPLEQFPVRKEGGIYRLAEDPDHRFALYASAGLEGKLVAPHNHTTWAVIAGVHGQEHNVRYDRVVTEGANDPNTVELAKGSELTVVKGNSIQFLPDDFHTIQVPAGGGPALLLHLYGLSLEHLPLRVMVELETKQAAEFAAPPKILTPLMGVADVKALMGTDDEVCFVDVREEGQFSTDGHPLFAICVPLSKLELRILPLVPNFATRIIVMDTGEEGQLGRAGRAASKLSLLGYGNVAVMDGGLKAWREAGYEVFTGVNVPSKAFGEIVEHDRDTPRVDAAEIKKMQDDGLDMVILDSRPYEEFHNMSIPGGIDCPGAELVYRVKDMAPNPETLVVVNCAGRTRSIIGAQSLINAGVPNKVIALKNGTMGWHLAGLEVARGKTDSFKPQSKEAAQWAREAAAKVAEKAGVKKIGLNTLRDMADDAAAKGGCLYAFDVRDPAEYKAGHLIGLRHAAGGQLVQATDQYVGVRNATIVLHDNDGVRATMTAHWLLQMGWKKVFVLDHRPGKNQIEIGPEKRGVPGLGAIKTPSLSPKELNALVERGEALVIDLDTSLRYRDGHIPGAWFATRANLAETLPKMVAEAPKARRIVLVSPDGVLARLASAEVAAMAAWKVATLAGGMKAWKEAGLPLENEHTRMADPPTDVWYRPYDRKEGIEAAMNQYLEWEVDLVAQVKRDGDSRFTVLTI